MNPKVRGVVGVEAMKLGEITWVNRGSPGLAHHSSKALQPLKVRKMKIIPCPQRDEGTTSTDREVRKCVLKL